MFTTYLGYTPEEIQDALAFANSRGWRAEPAHKPAPGDRYVAWDDRSELLLAGRDADSGWLAIRKNTTNGDEDVWRVNPGPLAEYYRYVPVKP